MDAGRRALEWNLDNQYSVEDPQAWGGIVGISRISGLIYRCWFPLECTNTSVFFGLALIEELKLSNK